MHLHLLEMALYTSFQNTFINDFIKNTAKNFHNKLKNSSGARHYNLHNGPLQRRPSRYRMIKTKSCMTTKMEQTNVSINCKYVNYYCELKIL